MEIILGIIGGFKKNFFKKIIVRFKNTIYRLKPISDTWPWAKQCIPCGS